VVTSLGRRKQFNKKNTYLGNDLPEFETNEEIVFPASFQRENHFPLILFGQEGEVVLRLIFQKNCSGSK